MKQFSWIYKNGDHRWGVIARDPNKPSHIVDTNEYLIAKGNEGIILDPGGAEIFPAVFSALSKEFDPTQIKTIFASHQDPDIASSLSLWIEVNPKLKCLVSWLWASFVPHYGVGADTFLTIPDEGMTFNLGSLPLQMVPAHYLHSSGNFNVYDATAKILFSGDIGAALLPADATGMYVENFDAHIRHSEMFHKRWMGSSEAVQRWCARVSKLDIDMMCPQHGAIYRGADVGRFIDWFGNLKVQLRRDAADKNSARDFGKDIIPFLVKNGKAVAHYFSRSCVRSGSESEAYWRDAGTVDAYWEANIDLTAVVPALDLYDRNWPIWTYGEITPPAKFVHDQEGRRGSAVASLVSGGCIVSGASLTRTLLFTGVRVHSYSKVENSVILPEVDIGRHVRLRNVVVDHGVHIPSGLVVGEDPERDARLFRRTSKGICLITQSMIDRMRG